MTELAIDSVITNYAAATGSSFEKTTDQQHRQYNAADQHQIIFSPITRMPGVYNAAGIHS